MSQDNLNAIPTRAELAECNPDSFVLQVAPEQGIRVSLLEVRDGVPMNGHHECYSLMLALPKGVVLPSNLYRLYSPAGEQWVLLFTPVMPKADGRAVLEAVIHRALVVPAGVDA
ncbi:hypothetical protein [Pseudomonas sp. MN1F]|uniref:DUF6916 family protein n=1 Tax=Pseudomonas sp. MN1F TaxID=1366632 RepID=UPI00128F2EFD|nr:hypothetical protein [Pseudomonas sp. MN1F]MQG95525.1 hypothetical protein [Pseudomonas sp. MN1F]